MNLRVSSGRCREMFKENNGKSVVLVACVGTSPAVLTETVWALAHETVPVVPEKVVVITTSTGRDRVVSELLAGDDPVWSQMNKALFKNPDRIKLGTTDIRVIPDANNNEADDLRSADDNMRAADFMLRVLRQYTEDPDTVVCASIAGGRKTMSALMLSCMSLLGREDDKVYHVLTTPEAMSFRPKFYFPCKGSFEYNEAGKTKKITGGKVKIELFEVPFVPIRGWFKEKYKGLPPSYERLVGMIRSETPRAVVFPSLEIDFDGVGNVRLLPSGRSVRLSAAEFVLLCVIATGVDPSAWCKRMTDLMRIVEAADFEMSVRWNDSFVEGSKFHDDVLKAQVQAAHCMSSMRRKFESRGFAESCSLVPKNNGSVTYPLSKITYKNVELLPTELRGYLLPKKDGK